MKAKDLKTLLSAIPDDEDVFYSAYDNYSEQWEQMDDFELVKYKTESGKSIYTICGEKPCGLLDEKYYLLTKDWVAFLDSFPVRKNWSYEKNSWSDFGVKVYFRVGSFQYANIVSMVNGKFFSYIGNSTTPDYFSSWSKFFALAEPVAIKAAQKQREELEGLLVD